MPSTNRPSHFRRLITIATVVAAGALLVAPASGMAFRFGAKLDTTTQPAGASTIPCMVAPGQSCTWAINDAYGRPNGGERSPFTGVIKKIRVIAFEAGSFRLQIVKVKPNGGDYLGKLIRNGPRIEYEGQPAGDDLEPFVIDSERVRIPVRKGQRLAIRATTTSALRCSSGGNNTLLFRPPLFRGGGFDLFDDGEGCWLLVEAIAKKS